jgi:hypothetical protein
MNRARGYLQIIDPAGSSEFETFTCAHCNSIVRMPHPDSPEEMKLKVKDVRRCHQCDALTCPKCAAIPQCTPFEKKLEAYEARGRLLQAAGVL